MMKLWYQSLARETESTPYGERLRKVIKNAADPDTEVHLQGVRKSAGIGVHYRFLAYHDTGEVIENAMKAQKLGFDAFMVGNISDSGLREAREVVSIPVLGLCESSVLTSCMMGANFGLISISDKWTQLLHENVNRYGLSSRLLATEPLQTSPLQLKKAMVDPAYLQEVMDQFYIAAQKLIDKGAEVIIPAGGDIMVFLAEMGIYQLGNTPIVNGMNEMIKMTEMAVRLKRLTGRFTSKARGYAKPEGDFLERIRKHYGSDVYPDE